MSSHISWVWSLEEKKTACTLHLLKDFTVYCQSKYIPYTQNHACSYHRCTQKDLQAQNDLAKIMNTSISNSHIAMSSIFWNLKFFFKRSIPTGFTHTIQLSNVEVKSLNQQSKQKWIHQLKQPCLDILLILHKFRIIFPWKNWSSVIKY